MSSGPLHLNTLIHNIIALLRRYDNGLSFDKLKSLLNLDISTSPELLNRLKNNPRIIVHDNKLEYRPPFSIKSGQELVFYMKENDDKSGILLSELRESYKTIDNDLSQSYFGDSIYKLSFNDSAAVYLNKLPGISAAPEEVKVLWSNANCSNISFND
jgi:hypothetical protein